MQSYNGIDPYYRTNSGLNHPSYYTIQDMKTLTIILLSGTAIYFAMPYIIVGSILLLELFYMVSYQ